MPYFKLPELMTSPFKLSIIFFLLNIVLCSTTLAQLHSNSAVYNRQTSSLLQELRPKPSDPRGKNYYHYQDWLVGDVILHNDKTISNQLMRYEILRNQMEISFNNKIVILEGRKIKTFEMINPYSSRKVTFTPCAEYELEKEKIIGFFEVLADGDIKLLSHKSIVVFGATKSVALSGSHRENSVFINERFFIARGDDIQEVGKGRKKDLKVFGDKAELVRKYANKNGLIFKRKNDLIEMVEYYNDGV